ncbi:hypothetical protein [Marinitoga lauensis]|uniref:hypothetical protein n=1 Tax=Marinitoga lauensis TaxID=2201189 RepID=UPI00101157B6|nr:hypothetical protein [Marinitoga lauensis]
MLLEYDNELFIFREDTIRTLELRRQGRVIEALPYLLQSWTLKDELNFRNIIRLKPELIENILNKAIEGYLIITNIDRLKLEMFIKSTFISSEINFYGFEENEIEHIKQCLLIKNNLFDHRGNMINFPEGGSFLDQNAKYMYFLNIYRKILIEKINEENNKRR